MSDDKYVVKILAAALRDQTAFEKLASEFEPSHFPKDYQEFVKIVFDVIGKQRSVLTEDVLNDYLQQQQVSADTSIAVQHAFGICNSATVDPKEVNYFVDTFKKTRADKILRGALQGCDADGEQLLDEFGKPIKSVTDLLVDEKNPYEAASILKKAVIDIENLSQEDPIIRVRASQRAEQKILDYEYRKTHKDSAIGILTGFGPIDDMTRGLHPGELFLFAGRPGTGKSIALVNVVKNMYCAGKSIMLLSLEMPYDQYEDRFISCYAGLDNQRMLLGALNEEEEQTLVRSWKEVGERKNDFEIIDFPKVNAFRIETELTRALDQYKPDVVVIDYLGIMKPNDKNSVADWEAQGRIAEEVRQIARLYKIPIVSAVQLNRSKDKTADTDRLSRSDIIAQTADAIIMINDSKKDDQLSDLMKFTMIKNRKGESAFEFEMYKDFSKVRIDNPPNYRSRLQELLAA